MNFFAFLTSLNRSSNLSWPFINRTTLLLSVNLTPVACRCDATSESLRSAVVCASVLVVNRDDNVMKSMKMNFLAIFTLNTTRKVMLFGLILQYN